MVTRHHLSPKLVLWGAIFLAGVLVGSHYSSVPAWLAQFAAFIARHKDTWAGLQSIITACALLVGAWWFLSRRQLYPRADVSHIITHRRLAPGVMLLQVRATVANKGSVMVDIEYGSTTVQQIAPPPADFITRATAGESPVPKGETEAPWPGIASCEGSLRNFHVEPGETDTVQWDFFLTDEVEAVQVYTYLRNERKRARNVGWPVQTVYDLKAEGEIQREPEAPRREDE